MADMRRDDGLSRDRIGGIARALESHLHEVEEANSRWRERRDTQIDAWQAKQERLARRRFVKLLTAGLVAFVLLGVMGGATLLLNSNQAGDINQSRLDGYRSSCIDSNDFRSSIQGLAVELGAPTDVVQRALPVMPSCVRYAERRFEALQDGASPPTFSAEARGQAARVRRGLDP